MIEIIKEVIIPLLQVVSVPAAAIFSLAYKNVADKKINKLKEQIRLITEIPLTFKNGLWYDNCGYPYCPVCYGKEGHKIPLEKRHGFNNRAGEKTPDMLHCHECNYETS